MSNSEIRSQINNLSNDYIARLVGLCDLTIKDDFIAWLAQYSDGFASVGQALAAYRAEISELND